MPANRVLWRLYTALFHAKWPPFLPTFVLILRILTGLVSIANPFHFFMRSTASRCSLSSPRSSGLPRLLLTGRCRRQLDHSGLLRLLPLLQTIDTHVSISCVSATADDKIQLCCTQQRTALPCDVPARLCWKVTACMLLPLYMHCWSAATLPKAYDKALAVHLCCLCVGQLLRQVGGHVGHVGPHVQRQHGLLLQMLLKHSAVPLH